MSTRKPKQTKTMYMHTLNDAPAVFCDNFNDPYIAYAMGYRTCAKLVRSLRQIRREQRIALANARTAPWTNPKLYGYIRVEVPRV